MATITFTFDAGRTDLQASRQRASDDAYWNFAAEAYEAYDAGNVADYGTALTESPSGTYTASAPDLSAAVAHVDRLYAQSGDLTAADLDLWLTEESSAAVPIPSPGTLGTPDPERVWGRSAGTRTANRSVYAGNSVYATPDSSGTCGVEFGNLLPGETIASVTLSQANASELAALTLSDAETNTDAFSTQRGVVVPASEGAVFTVTGGESGTYELTVVATTSEGRAIPRICRYVVDDGTEQ